jgi:hypothetical protein
VAPAGIFVAADSPIRDPADLAGVPISVGWQSGSHYSTIQALEAYLPADKINLSFAEGLLFRRLEMLVKLRAPAVALFSGPYYFAEQLGFRKIIDTTFMIATMIHGDPDPPDLSRFFRALRRAQRDLGPAPRPLHALLQERIPRALPPADRHPPLGPRRAARLRALHEASPRRDRRLDRKARHLRRRRDGPRPLRRFGDFAGGYVVATAFCETRPDRTPPHASPLLIWPAAKSGPVRCRHKRVRSQRFVKRSEERHDKRCLRSVQNVRITR